MVTNGNNNQMSREKLLFGKKLRQFRKLAKLNQIDLATELGYKDGSSAISQIERGLKGMQQDKLLKLSEVLGVPTAVLFSQDEYTDEQAKMILAFFKLIKQPRHPHYEAVRTLLK